MCEASSTTRLTGPRTASFSVEDLRRSLTPAPPFRTYYGRQPYPSYLPSYTQQQIPTYRFSPPPGAHSKRQASQILPHPKPGNAGSPLAQPKHNFPPTRQKRPADTDWEDTLTSKAQLVQDPRDRLAWVTQSTRTPSDGGMQEIQDIREGDGRRCCALNSCALFALIVTIIVLLLLGVANKLLQAVGEEFADRDFLVGVKEPRIRPNISRTTWLSSDPISKPLVECTSDSCLWEAEYILGKLNYTVNPCSDFYSHVCSSEWFKNDQDVNTHPYTHRASATVMVALWDYLKSRPAKESPTSFISHAAFLAKGCVKGPQRDAEWATFRDIFGDLNIPGWPYESDLLDTEPHDVAKVTDKLLGTAAFVRVSLGEQRSSSRELHIDSPPIFLRRYETIFPGEYLRTYGDFVFKVLSLWKPPSKHTHNLALEIVLLEQTMSDAAAHSARSVPSVHVTRPVAAFHSLHHWDWVAYFSYYIQEVTPSISASMTVLLDPLYVDHLYAILYQTRARTLINYIGYRLVVYLSPLLPVSKADFIVPLSHQYQLANVPERLQACLFLLERTYPFGMRFLVWSTILSKAHPLLTGEAGLADDIKRVEDLVRIEMKRSAATAPWLTQSESTIAAEKVDRMGIEMIPPDDEMSLPSPSFQPSAAETGKLLSTYYKLLRSVRSQYWTVQDRTHFREPSTPSESAFRPGFSFSPERNVISLSPATVAFARDVSRRFEATSLPFLIAPLVRGMFSVMDLRGSVINAEGAVSRWWSPDSEDRFLTRAQCLQDSFTEATMAYIKEGIDHTLFIEEVVTDGAVLRPMYNVFVRFARREEVMAAIPGQPANVTFAKLFFINYATTFCDPPRSAAFSKKQLRYKVDVPAKLRVNVPLSRFRVFADVFECPHGTAMNPTRSCSFW